MSYILEIFGNNVKKYRKKAGLTLEKTAENIGVSYQNLSKIESGTGFVTAKTLEKICETLKIKPHKLFTIEELPETNKSSNHKELLIKLMENLDEKEQKSVYKLVSLFLEQIH